MSYKDKATTYRGGAIGDPEPPRVRLRYPCFAVGCPMPGTLWPGATQGGTGDTPGTCAWHYGVQPQDIPRVTKALQEWACVSFEVNEARRVLTGETATDPKAIGAAFAAAWERMRPLVPGWEEQLKPGNIRTSKGEERPFHEGYGDWAKRLERFVGARVGEVLSIRQRRAA